MWTGSMVREVSSEEALKMCVKCYSFAYGGEWHIEKPKFLDEKDANESITIKLAQCPSCVEESLAMYDMEYA